jgi:hypothetical protein
MVVAQRREHRLSSFKCPLQIRNVGSVHMAHVSAGQLRYSLQRSIVNIADEYVEIA